jgi:hypothetical protein
MFVFLIEEFNARAGGGRREEERKISTPDRDSCYSATGLLKESQGLAFRYHPIFSIEQPFRVFLLQIDFF